MNLNQDICYRAIRTRDKRFDGRFFTGVTSTGIFCRPICPAVTPKAKHCRFLPSAAAALDQGFRPCLRCRPESAPGSPAWNGVSTTVSRAMNLIRDGALVDGNVEALSDRLGVTSRHLRRLFQEHLGASPAAVARAQRLLFAVQLIHETRLPLNQIAIHSGYGSVRRFNDSIKQLYGRSPGELRRSRTSKTCGAHDNMIRIKLGYQPPYDWPRLLYFLQSRAIPGVEVVDNGIYRRVISSGDAAGILEVGHDQAAAKLLFAFDLNSAAVLQSSVSRIRRMFDLETDREKINRQFARDPVLGPLVAARPGLCVPGAWDTFELGVRAILGQQVSVKAARTLAGRLVQRFGEPLTDIMASGVSHRFPSPEQLAGVDISKIGLPRKRAASISSLAEVFASDETGLEQAGDLDAIQKTLCRLPGVGPWTAQYMAMRALAEPDAFPSGDLGVLRALQSLGVNCDLKTMQLMAENWRPFRASATLHLWTALAESGHEAR